MKNIETQANRRSLRAISTPFSLLAAVALSLSAAPAMAHDHGYGYGHEHHCHRHHHHDRHCEREVVYVQPQVRYVQPSTVYVQPAPVYVRPAPVYVRPAPVTYVQPAPVYVQSAPVYQSYQSTPVYPAAPRANGSSSGVGALPGAVAGGLIGFGTLVIAHNLCWRHHRCHHR